MNKKDAPPSLLRELGLIIGKLVLVGLALCILMLIVYGAARNTDSGMKGSVKQGDLIFYYRLDKQYIASDIVVLEYEGNIQTRRVIAVAGDTVDITADGMAINGNLQQENGSDAQILPYTDGINFPVTLTEGQVFLLGDDRDAAIDSRLYGAVETKDTLGKMVLLLRRREF